MQIKVNLQIFLFMIIFVLTHQIEMYAWVMIFAIIHELGHLVAGLLLKLKPKTLSLMPLGIRVTFEDYEYKKLIEMKKITLALAGPLTNFLIAIFTVILPIDMHLKETIIYSNILIGTFNLIPLYPLDGGKILKGLIRLKYSSQRTDKLINRISNLTIIFLTAISSIAILYLKNIAIIFILVYLWVMVIKENKIYNIKKKMYETIEKTNKCIDI